MSQDRKSEQGLPQGTAFLHTGDGSYRPELLAPAGSPEAFRAAMAAGADAVYLAGNRFGARAYADNFGPEELLRTLDEAHRGGAAIHLTVNTLTRESEMEDLLAFLAPLVQAGLDAVIVQDLGVIARIHREYPELAIHASTQLSVCHPDAVPLLAGLGVTRIVPARELSLAELIDLKSGGPVEIESFIHGAMCYSYSGKCLFSSFLGGRSGNRGRCAQPCRLPYSVYDEEGRRREKECYPLSMRDMNASAALPELLRAGIDAFKIEGRMKKPEYVAGVTRVYRRAIDRWLSEPERTDLITPEEKQTLSSLYIRSLTGEGYYHRRNGREMVTLGDPAYSASGEEMLRELRAIYEKAPVRQRITQELVLEPGKPAKLTVSTKDRPGPASLTVEGEAVQAAKARPLTEEDVRRSLEKTGESGFISEAIRVQIIGQVFMPVSHLNSLRRSALAALGEELGRLHVMRQRAMTQARREILGETGTQTTSSARLLPGRMFLQVATRAQFEALQPLVESSEGAICVIDDTGRFELAGEDALLALPYILRRDEDEYVTKAMALAKEGAYQGLLVRSLEGLGAVRRHFAPEERPLILGDSFLPVWNRTAHEALAGDADGIVLPDELSGREMEETLEAGEELVLAVYGRTPLMLSANCLRMTEGACPGRGQTTQQGFWHLTDRKGLNFPVRYDCAHCGNIIYNSVPLSLHHQTPIQAADRVLLRFTDEKPGLCREIARAAYDLYLSGDRSGMARLDELLPDYTTGHYRKGAL